MTIETLARITQAEFSSIRKKLATKDDLRMVATRADVAGLKDTVIEAVRDDNLKVLRSNDKVMTKLDTLLKEDAAHTPAHKRIEEKLHEHGERLSKLEKAAR